MWYTFLLENIPFYEIGLKPYWIKQNVKLWPMRRWVFFILISGLKAFHLHTQTAHSKFMAKPLRFWKTLENVYCKLPRCYSFDITSCIAGKKRKGLLNIYFHLLAHKDCMFFTSQPFGKNILKTKISSCSIKLPWHHVVASNFKQCSRLLISLRSLNM